MPFFLHMLANYDRKISSRTNSQNSLRLSDIKTGICTSNSGIKINYNYLYYAITKCRV